MINLFKTYNKELEKFLKDRISKPLYSKEEITDFLTMLEKCTNLIWREFHSKPTFELTREPIKNAPKTHGSP
jgi:hypothetical protein